MQQNSSTQKAKLKVGQSVKVGAHLGDEDKVGCVLCAGGDHHFEDGVPRATNPATTTDGFLADNGGNKRNREPRACCVAGGVFQ